MGAWFENSWEGRFPGWSDRRWNKRQRLSLFLAALAPAHWVPWFSDSYLSRTKLHHTESHSALNLQMKSHLVSMLQWCKSKPLTFLLIAKKRRVSEAQISSPSTTNIELLKTRTWEMPSTLESMGLLYKICWCNFKTTWSTQALQLKKIFGICCLEYKMSPIDAYVWAFCLQKLVLF